MKFSGDTGVKIEEEIRSLLEKAIELAGNNFQLSKQIGVNNQTITNWRGKSSQIGEYIMWEQWRLLRKYLVAHQLIDPTDPRWMLPSEMRARIYELQRLLEEARRSAETNPAAIVTAEQFRTRLIRDTLSSGLPREDVEKFITLISECGR